MEDYKLRYENWLNDPYISEKDKEELRKTLTNFKTTL